MQHASRKGRMAACAIGPCVTFLHTSVNVEPPHVNRGLLAAGREPNPHEREGGTIVRGNLPVSWFVFYCTEGAVAFLF